MSSIPGATGRSRYLIRSRNDETPLTDLLGDIGSDPAIAVIDTIGPAGKPHTVVAEMSEDTARSLKQRFDPLHQLIIEPDRPLSPFQ
jgi:hypothetical protein